MGIPRKFTTRGYSVIPFDLLPFNDEKIFPNMYWYFGQQDMKAAELLKDETEHLRHVHHELLVRARTRSSSTT